LYANASAKKDYTFSVELRKRQSINCDHVEGESFMKYMRIDSDSEERANMFN